MRNEIQNTETFKSLDGLQKKIYLSKNSVDRLKHFYQVAMNRGIAWMKTTQHPTQTEYAIIKDLLTE